MTEKRKVLGRALINSYGTLRTLFVKLSYPQPRECEEQHVVRFTLASPNTCLALGINMPVVFRHPGPAITQIFADNESRTALAISFIVAFLSGWDL